MWRDRAQRHASRPWSRWLCAALVRAAATSDRGHHGLTMAYTTGRSAASAELQTSQASPQRRRSAPSTARDTWPAERLRLSQPPCAFSHWSSPTDCTGGDPQRLSEEPQPPSQATAPTQHPRPTDRRRQSTCTVQVVGSGQHSPAHADASLSIPCIASSDNDTSHTCSALVSAVALFFNLPAPPPPSRASSTLMQGAGVPAVPPPEYAPPSWLNGERLARFQALPAA